jgi:Flp pilus assembly protein TadG
MIVMLRRLAKFGTRATGSLWRDERGIGTLEIVLIAAVLVMVAVFFKDWIIEFVGNLMDSVEGKADDIFK